MNGKNKNIIVEKSRNKADSVYENDDTLVQTNTDRSKADPDERRTVA